MTVICFRLWCSLLTFIVSCLFNHFKNDKKQLLKNSVLSSQVKYLFKFKGKTFEDVKEINCETCSSQSTDDDD